MASPLRFAVAGHPITHSASPAMHTAALRSLGLPHAYEAIDCPSANAFARVVGLLRRGYFAGLNVTAPYKAQAVELSDSVDDDAKLVGAANTLRMAQGRVEATNTDIPGLLEVLQHAGPRTGVALIIGSGAAARSSLLACQRLGVRLIGVTSRSWQSTEVLFEAPSAEFFREQRALTFPWPAAGQSDERTRGSIELQLQLREFAAMADLLVQATSAGLPGGDSGDAVAALVPWERVPPHALVVDLIYGPTPTPFLQAAERRGLRSLDGLELLARQGARSLSLWLGRPAPFVIMRDAARRHVLGTAG